MIAWFHYYQSLFELERHVFYAIVGVLDKQPWYSYAMFITVTGINMLIWCWYAIWLDYFRRVK